MKKAEPNTSKQYEREQCMKKMLDYGTVLMWKVYHHQFRQLRVIKFVLSGFSHKHCV